MFVCYFFLLKITQKNVSNKQIFFGFGKKNCITNKKKQNCWSVALIFLLFQKSRYEMNDKCTDVFVFVRFVSFDIDRMMIALFFWKSQLRFFLYFTFSSSAFWLSLMKTTKEKKNNQIFFRIHIVVVLLMIKKIIKKNKAILIRMLCLLLCVCVCVFYQNKYLK